MNENDDVDDELSLILLLDLSFVVIPANIIEQLLVWRERIVEFRGL